MEQSFHGPGDFLDRTAGGVHLVDRKPRRERLDQHDVERFREGVRGPVPGLPSHPPEPSNELRGVTSEHDHVGHRQEMGQVTDYDPRSLTPLEGAEGPSEPP